MMSEARLPSSFVVVLLWSCLVIPATVNASVSPACPIFPSETYLGRLFSGSYIDSGITLATPAAPTLYACDHLCRLNNRCIASSFDESQAEPCRLFDLTNIQSRIKPAAASSVVILHLPLDCGEDSAVNGTWTSWTTTIDCSPQTTPCGQQSTKTETRTCQPPLCSGEGCTGDSNRETPCPVIPCPDDPLPWTQWSSCSVSCGNGSSSREQSNSSYHNVETRPCQMNACGGTVAFHVTSQRMTRDGGDAACQSHGGLAKLDPNSLPESLNDELMDNRKYWFACSSPGDPTQCSCNMGMSKGLLMQGVQLNVQCYNNGEQMFVICRA